MTSLPQTQRPAAARDARRRVATSPPGSNSQIPASRRSRQGLPAVDSKEFGCVDWFLYPDSAAAESQAARVPA
jgi:hypothetical protein